MALVGLSAVGRDLPALPASESPPAGVYREGPLRVALAPGDGVSFTQALQRAYGLTPADALAAASSLELADARATFAAGCVVHLGATQLVHIDRLEAASGVVTIDAAAPVLARPGELALERPRLMGLSPELNAAAYLIAQRWAETARAIPGATVEAREASLRQALERQGVFRSAMERNPEGCVDWIARLARVTIAAAETPTRRFDTTAAGLRAALPYLGQGDALAATVSDEARCVSCSILASAMSNGAAGLRALAERLVSDDSLTNGDLYPLQASLIAELAAGRVTSLSVPELQLLQDAVQTIVNDGDMLSGARVRPPLLEALGFTDGETRFAAAGSTDGANTAESLSDAGRDRIAREAGALPDGSTLFVSAALTNGEGEITMAHQLQLTRRGSDYIVTDSGGFMRPAMRVARSPSEAAAIFGGPPPNGMGLPLLLGLVRATPPGAG